MARKVSHKRRMNKRRGKVKQNIIGDMASAAKGMVSSGVESVRGGAEKVAEVAAPYVAPVAAGAAVVAGVVSYKAAEAAGLIPKQGPVAVSPRRGLCPSGYARAPDGSCYPRRLASYIPTGPAKEPRVTLSTPGTLSAPSSESFGASLKTAAPAVVRGRPVPGDLLMKASSEGAASVIESVSRQMARTRKNISGKKRMR